MILTLFGFAMLVLLAVCSSVVTFLAIRVELDWYGKVGAMTYSPGMVAVICWTLVIYTWPFSVTFC